MRIRIVTGSRSHTGFEQIYAELNRERPDLVVHGACPTGADAIADRWCETTGTPCARMPAWWRAFEGNSAGPIRNGWMVKFFPTAELLAFPYPNSKGTWDCVRQAKEAGLKVRVFK